VTCSVYYIPKFLQAANLPLYPSGHCYVALKICTHAVYADEQINHEINIYKHLSGINSMHQGQAYIRILLDSFEITGTSGVVHQCLIHEPLALDLASFQKLLEDRRGFPEDLVRAYLRRLLRALDFLHSEANIIHTDIKATNIMLSIAEYALLEDFVNDEMATPSPRKILTDREIYLSRNFRNPTEEWGNSILCDFGGARIGRQKFSHIVQPAIYRAPEVVLNMDWDHKIDIWNVGALVSGYYGM